MLVVILADRDHLGQAKALQPLDIAERLRLRPGKKSLDSDRFPLVVGVALGIGGGVVLAGEPLSSLSAISWPSDLGPKTGREHDEVLDAVYEAVHVGGDPHPEIRVLHFVKPSRFRELFNDLEKIPGVTIESLRQDPPEVLEKASAAALSALRGKVARDSTSPQPTGSPTQKASIRITSQPKPRPVTKRPAPLNTTPSKVQPNSLSFVERRAIQRFATRAALRRLLNKLLLCLPLWLFTPVVASFATLAIPNLRKAVFAGAETGATAGDGPETLYINLAFALGMALALSFLAELVFGPPKETLGNSLLALGIFLGLIYFTMTLISGSIGMGTWYAAPALACLGLVIASSFSGLRAGIRNGFIRNLSDARTWVG